MLVEFTVENFRSYRAPRTLNLAASTADELHEHLSTTESGERILRSAAIYGPNASGKSNLLAAMHCLHSILTTPFTRIQSVQSGFMPFPFALARSSQQEPSRFTVKFFAGNVLYEYRLAVRPGVIEEESLHAYPLGRQQEWFHRTRQEFKFNDTHLKGKKKQLEDFVSEAFPFLGVALAFGQTQLAVPGAWLVANFGDRFNRFHASRSPFPNYPTSTTETTAKRCQSDKDFNNWTASFLRHADLGIENILVEVTEEKRQRPVTTPTGKAGERVTSIQELIEQHHEPYFIHTGDNIRVRFGLDDESHGTRRLFAMIEPLFDVLRTGSLAIIDELSASMHPTLVTLLIKMFHTPEMNRLGAQLVFTTHDTSILSGQFFRRDQIWFTEKDKNGATDLYSLHDFKGVREGGSFGKNYLKGKYGAIPFFTEFDFPAPATIKAEANREA